MTNKENEIRIKDVKSIQTKTWYDGLESSSGGKSTHWFANHCKIGSSHVRTWKRYKLGKRYPIIIQGFNLVDELAKEFIDSDKVFKSPLWSILKGEKYTTSQVTEALGQLGPTHRAIVRGYGLWPFKEPEGDLFSTDKLIAELSTQPNFETLETIFILMAGADTAGNKLFRNDLDFLYRHLIPYLILENSIPFIGELFNLLDKFSSEREFVHCYETKDIHKSWREELPRYKTMLFDHYDFCLKASFKYASVKPEFSHDDGFSTLVKVCINTVWKEEALVLQSPELWKPMSWVFIKHFKGHLAGLKISDRKFAALMRNEISYFLDKRDHEAGEDDFCIKLK